MRGYFSVFGGVGGIRGRRLRFFGSVMPGIMLDRKKFIAKP